MFIRSFCTTLCAVVLAVVPASGAFAAENPIPGIDIIVQKKPGDVVVARTTTDAKGEFTLKDLAPGKYTIEIDGKGLVAATARKGTSGGTPPGDGPPIIAVLVGLLLPAVQARGGAPTPQTFHGKATARGMQIELVVPDGPAKSYKGTLTR
ncbi:MAG: carboxypeptidase-like regulatory domain-containing protein [Reyranella sp.]|nr:carboxypeptidase-like regulatory domain-containing protein [Reyranella sp.]